MHDAGIFFKHAVFFFNSLSWQVVVWVPPGAAHYSHLIYGVVTTHHQMLLIKRWKRQKCKPLRGSAQFANTEEELQFVTYFFHILMCSTYLPY